MIQTTYLDELDVVQQLLLLVHQCGLKVVRDRINPVKADECRQLITTTRGDRKLHTLGSQS